MKITVKTTQQQVFQIDIEGSDTVAILKSEIQGAYGHPVDGQEIIYSGKILTDEKTIESCGIKEKDFLVLMISEPNRLQQKGTPVHLEAKAATAAPTTPNTPVTSDQQLNINELANNPQMQQLRSLIQQNPEFAQLLIQQLVIQNPAIAQAIAQNPDILQILGIKLDSDGQDAMSVTEEEKTVIQRLEGRGFSRQVVLEAYFICDKNEEVAIDYLREGGFEH